MKLVPLEDRVIVRVLEEEERTSSGIVLPDTAKEKPQKAKVVAVGPGRYEDGKQIPVGVSEGDTVVFSCLLYTSDAADDLTRVDLGGRRIIKKKIKNKLQITI